MQSLKEIMEELGFNVDASESSKKAFIKHLISAAQSNNVTHQKSLKNVKQNQSTRIETQSADKSEAQQLEFDFSADKRVS